MRNLLVLTLVICCVLQDGSTVKVKKIKYTKNPELKMYRLIKGNPYEIIHVIDSSGSVKEDGFKIAVQEAQDINEAYNWKPFGVGGSKAAAIEFSTPDDTKVVFDLLPYKDVDDINDKIKAMEYRDGSSTALGKGLRLAKTQYTTLSSGTGNERIVWLFTDGHKNSGNFDPEQEANFLKNNLDVKLCIHAIGPDIFEGLEDWASPDCFFRYENAEDYGRAVKKAVRLVLTDRRVNVRRLKRKLASKNRKGR